MGKVCSILQGLKLAMVMAVVQTTFAGMNVLYKLAANDGMSLRIITAYRFLFTVPVKVPLALLIESENDSNRTREQLEKRKKTAISLDLKERFPLLTMRRSWLHRQHGRQGGEGELKGIYAKLAIVVVVLLICTLSLLFWATISGDCGFLQPSEINAEELWESAKAGGWRPSSVPTTNGGLSMLIYWQGYYGSTNGLPPQQQPLLRLPPGLPMRPFMQQSMQYLAMNVSLPVAASNLPASQFFENSQLLPPFAQKDVETVRVSSPELTLAPDISAFIRRRAAAYPMFVMIEGNTVSKTSFKTGSPKTLNLSHSLIKTKALSWNPFKKQSRPDSES